MTELRRSRQHLIKISQIVDDDGLKQFSSSQHMFRKTKPPIEIVIRLIRTLPGFVTHSRTYFDFVCVLKKERLLFVNQINCCRNHLLAIRRRQCDDCNLRKSVFFANF